MTKFAATAQVASQQVSSTFSSFSMVLQYQQGRFLGRLFNTLAEEMYKEKLAQQADKANETKEGENSGVEEKLHAQHTFEYLFALFLVANNSNLITIDTTISEVLLILESTQL